MSIYKRKDRKGWRIEISFVDAKGKPCRKFSNAKTRKEAIQKESALINEIGKAKVEKLLFSDITSSFLDEAKRTRRYSTYKLYERILRIHLLPFFDIKVFTEITRKDIQEWKDKIEKGDYSLSYKQHCYTTLSMVFHHAKKEYGLINTALESSSNFSHDPNEVSTKEDKKLTYWEPWEFEKWLATINGAIEREEDNKTSLIGTKILVSICYYAGLRKGEANALLLSDYKTGDYPSLKVTKSVSQQLGLSRYLVTDPKNKTSIRTVPVCKDLQIILDDHVKNFLSRVPVPEEQKYLVYGIAPIPNTTAESVKNRIEKEAGIRHIRIHDLRHSFASNLINAGVPITTVSKLCGHASTEITYRIYSHLFPETGAEAMDEMQKYINSHQNIKNE